VTKGVVFIFKLADRSSRHRMALRRELLRLGGVNLQPGVWFMPSDRSDQRLRRVHYLVQRANGRVLLAELEVGPRELETFVKERGEDRC
jgi:DNA-binding transcriptional regulator PaaX